MIDIRTYDPKVETFWNDFCSHAGVEGHPFDVDMFGDSPSMADELAALVLEGTKRATCALARWYDPAISSEAVRPPKPGDHSIILNGSGDPVCVIETTQVDIQPVSAADAAFAWDEGEGDRSLDYWLREHRAFFEREAEANDFTYTDDSLAVFERFKVVWPLPRADET